MENDFYKKRYDYLVSEINKCSKILQENSTEGKELSWKIFWIRADTHKRRLSAMRELDKLKNKNVSCKRWI